jgi:hypothetical protein
MRNNTFLPSATLPFFMDKWESMPQVLLPKARATYPRHAVLLLVETPLYKAEGCWFNSRQCHLLNLSGRIMTQVLTRSLTGPCLGLTDNLNIREPQPSRTVRACHGRCRVCLRLLPRL